MSLNDQILEGDFYNSHNTKKEDTASNYDAVAKQLVQNLFKKPLHRRIYESIKTTTKRATHRLTRKRR